MQPWWMMNTSLHLYCLQEVVHYMSCGIWVYEVEFHAFLCLELELMCNATALYTRDKAKDDMLWDEIWGGALPERNWQFFWFEITNEWFSTISSLLLGFDSIIIILSGRMHKAVGTICVIYNNVEYHRDGGIILTEHGPTHPNVLDILSGWSTTMLYIIAYTYCSVLFTLCIM